MTMRCKMQLQDVIRTSYGQRKAFFSCQYDQSIPEDQRFQIATPTGSCDLMIDNPAVTDQLVIGEFYYVDFNPVPKQ